MKTLRIAAVALVVVAYAGLGNNSESRAAEAARLPDDYPILIEPDKSDPRFAAYIAWHRAVLANDFETYLKLSACFSQGTEEQKRWAFHAVREFAPEVVKVANIKEFQRGGIEFTAVGCKNKKRYVSVQMVIEEAGHWKVACTSWGPPWNSSIDVCPL